MVLRDLSTIGKQSLTATGRGDRTGYRRKTKYKNKKHEQRVVTKWQAMIEEKEGLCGGAEMYMDLP